MTNTHRLFLISSSPFTPGTRLTPEQFYSLDPSTSIRRHILDYWDFIIPSRTNYGMGDGYTCLRLSHKNIYEVTFVGDYIQKEMNDSGCIYPCENSEIVVQREIKFNEYDRCRLESTTFKNGNKRYLIIENGVPVMYKYTYHDVQGRQHTVEMSNIENRPYDNNVVGRIIFDNVEKDTGTKWWP